jgi:ribosome biogenesis GTPase / thiamine phosphate phosphatase
MFYFDRHVLVASKFNTFSRERTQIRFDEFMNGRVLKSTGSNYEVLLENGEVQDCRARGKLRLKGYRSTNPVAVGDHVDVDEVEGEYVITNIHTRDNHLIRKATNLSKESHIIAANVDQLILLITLKSPNTSCGFMDRVLVSAESYHIPSVLVFNKIDVLDEHDMQRLEDLIVLYRGLGYTCMSASLLEDVPKELIALFKNKVSLLSGHSGVGKSTLANILQPGLDLKTAEVSSSFNKGKHTTTFAQMYPLADGGFIVDTPGIKGFGVVEVEPKELSHYFLEMRELLPECKFNDCQHIIEPGCAVLKALGQGKIAESRYASYLSIYRGEEGPYRKDIYV